MCLLLQHRYIISSIPRTHLCSLHLASLTVRASALVRGVTALQLSNHPIHYPPTGNTRLTELNASILSISTAIAESQCIQQAWTLRRVLPSNESRKRNWVEESESLTDLPGKDTQDADGEVNIDETGDHARGSSRVSTTHQALTVLSEARS